MTDQTDQTPTAADLRLHGDAAKAAQWRTRAKDTVKRALASGTPVTPTVQKGQDGRWRIEEGLFD